MKKIILFFGLILVAHMYAQSPLSKFNATVTSTNAVSFSNTSSGNPNSVLWEFTGGNPSTSTDPNPSVSYSAVGIYTAKLTVSNASGSSVSTRTVKITSGNIIDLCTARNNDGTLMNDPEPDPDWSYTDTNGVVSTPVTRYTFTGWSSASTGDVVGISRWITGNNAITGYHEYRSKEIEIPTGVTTAVLNLRSLSFVRNWTYLVQKNTDGTETETQITQTTYMSDGAKGWLNSRSPEVINYPLSPGKYYIKVKAYTNNGSQRQAIDVNANVNFGNAIAISPIAEFSANPLSSVVGSNVQFTNLSQGTPSSLLWKFEDGPNVLTSTLNNPAIVFSTTGSHYVELSTDYGNSLTSSLKINNYIQTTQFDAPIVAVTQPTCNISTGSITVTSPSTGVTYSFDNGVTFQPTNSISGLVSGTYLVKVKNTQGAISNAASAVINPAFPTEISLNTTQSSCTSNTGSITITSPSSGVEYSFDGGITYQPSNAKNNLAAGVYQIVVKNNECVLTKTVVLCDADCKDFTKAPNSYIFDPTQNNNGLYIPVKKAYAMWKDQNGLLNDTTVLNGTPTAEVYWEEVSGLIRSTNYSLPLVGDGECARIKIEVDKAKGKGNAVVALKINSKIIWSWHIWVTDDPTDGVIYGNVEDNNTVAGLQDATYVENGVTKTFTPKWMDRNLGATNKNFIGYDWDKSSGLMYQWGRKDPFPSLENKDGSMYEVSGSIGVKKHTLDYTGDSASNKLSNMQRPFDDINSNIKYAVNNPLNLMFTNIIGGDGWFVKTIGTDAASRKKADLWGDNSENSTTTLGSAKNTYKVKTSYDPCPNGWRIPSHLNNTAGTTSYFSPWGRNRNRWIGGTSPDKPSYFTIKPTATNATLNGIKIYGGLGIDFSNTTTQYTQGQFSRNMGIYSGSGKYVVGSTGDFYHQDPAEIVIQSATMAAYAPEIYFFKAVLDPGQLNDSPDTTLFSGMKGRYNLSPFETATTMATSACRCIEDKYASNYNFPTEYFNSNNLVNYTEGITNPNSYRITGTTTGEEIKIPISKAFSVYNQYLSDHGMLDFNNLKVNVYWTDNRTLISNVKIVNPPTSVNGIKDAYISVTVAGDQPGNIRNAGNALVSLHNGSISSPAYWSWHVWVTNTDVNEIHYQTEDVLLPSTSNYVNFTNSGGQPMKSKFMDRNLGATDAFPDVLNPESVNNETELPLINHSAGMQYQWGRKDPIPSFINPGVVAGNGVQKTGEYSIWTSSGPDSNGNIYSSSFTELTGNTYENTYVKRRGVDYGTVGITKAENIRNNLKYSAENPLAFMIPSQKYTNRSTLNVIYGQDWLYSTPNQMMDRWGHATVKSVFDPCPGGWRVPDIAISIVDNDGNEGNDDKGSSPWYNGFFMPAASTDKFRIHNLGIQQNTDYDIKNPSDVYNGGAPYYPGSIVKNATTVFGYQLNIPADVNNPNSKYKIGNYPVTGFRGFSNYETISASMKLGISGVWTAALRSINSYGTAYNLAFLTNSLTSSKLIAMNDAYINHPMNAMNVRCVREESRFGQILGVANNTGIINGSPVNAKNTSKNVANVEKDTDIEVYPNPFNNYVIVKGENLKSYELYDVSGKLIKQGSLKEKTIYTNDLIKGVYMLKLYTTQATTMKKIIK